MGGKSHRGGGQGREPQAQSLSPASLCVARCQGAERSSYIPLKKIDLFTVTFSIVSWVFGKEHLPAPQAFRGADGGLLQTEEQSSGTYGFCVYVVGGGAGVGRT